MSHVRSRNYVKTVEDDERIDPRIREAFRKYKAILGIANFFLEDGQTKMANTREDVLQYQKEKAKLLAQRLQKEVGSMELPSVPLHIRSLWSSEGLVQDTKTILSKPDNNQIKILIYRPENITSDIPCVVYIHGGAMSYSSAFDPQYKVFGKMIAKQGVLCALVDFRNSIQKTESNKEIAPYPGGLNDCYSALEWIYENAKDLKVDKNKIILAGESGGGNLTIATALKCKKQGTLHYIKNGFVPMCPYIAGSWPQSVQNVGILGSSHLDTDNNGLFISLSALTNEVIAYGLDAFEKRDPMAWPGFATVNDVRGLPKCMIIVNECDPLRDEGLNFYRLLLRAGVQARCLSQIGTPHGGMLMASFAPDITIDTAKIIADFARTSVQDDSKL